MDNSNFKIEEVFDSAVNIVRNLPKEGPIKPSDDLKLKLYAYFKQATHGPNDTAKPRFYQIVEAYKWDAWNKLGDMSKDDAMLNYIRELKLIMNTIPKDETDLDETKHFEDVLGKKFYDYWFSQWQRGEQQQFNTSSREMIASSSYSSDVREQAGRSSITKGNDNQNDSSSGSSVSMLEDTQSAGGDGYKTPNLTHNITNQMSDQFALAILRLQHGLDETRKQLSHFEGQLKSSMDRIGMLENQTFAKQPPSGEGSGRTHKKGPIQDRTNSPPARLNMVARLLNSFGEKNKRRKKSAPR